MSDSDLVRVIDTDPGSPPLIRRKTAQRRVRQGRARWADPEHRAIIYRQARSVMPVSSLARERPARLLACHWHVGIYDPNFYRTFARYPIPDLRTRYDERDCV